MEAATNTVSTIADAAMKAVWGDQKAHGDEPISGQTGDVSKGEPYDAGNIETTKAPNEEIRNETSSAPAPAAADTTASRAPADADEKGSAPSSAAAAANEDDAVKSPADLDNIPAPRPLDQLAREGGGDAAKALASEQQKEEPQQERRQSQAGGTAMGKGDGTQYVKTSGLQADGGDFDATKPGAGKEAERLMEQKGIATPAAAQAAAKEQQSQPAENQSMTSKTSTGSGSSSGSNGKKGLREKIKEKLHRN